MGFISNLLNEAKGSPRSGERLWQRVFDVTSKEERMQEPTKPAQASEGGWARSASSDNAIKRLLTALRSNAPGGWTDNRWEQSKAFHGIVYVAGHRKYEQMAQSEFQVFRKDPNAPDGKVQVKEGEPGSELIALLERPNNEDSFGDLVYQWGQQMDLTGMALTWMVPNLVRNQHRDERYQGKGTPYEIYCIPTATAIPQPTINPEYPYGYYRVQPLYPYGPFSNYPTPNSSVGAPLPAEWVMRFKFPHPLLRYDGYSPLTGLREHVDEVRMIDRSRHYKMRRSINPEAVLNFEDSETSAPLPDAEIDRIKAEFEAEQQGPENAGRLYVATPGAKLEPWGTSPREMDYPAGWEQLVSFVMAGLGITKPAAGMIEEASYAALFSTLKQLHLLTLKPMCDRFAAKLTRFLAPFFGPDLIIEIRCPRIDDHEVKAAKIDQCIGAKCITKNEVRKENDLPLTDEPWGEDIAGDPSPNEQQQIQQDQAAMQEQAEGDRAVDMAKDEGGRAMEMAKLDQSERMAAEDRAAKQDELEIQRMAPTPGNLSRNSRGPQGKSLVLNGNGRIKVLSKNNAVKKGVEGIFDALRKV